MKTPVRFCDGLDKFARGDYFAAHEDFEALWRRAAERDREFLQGLTQACAALHHYAHGNLKGPRRMLAGIRRRLAGDAAARWGVDAAKLAGVLAGLVEPLQNLPEERLPGACAAAVPRPAQAPPPPEPFSIRL